MVDVRNVRKTFRIGFFRKRVEAVRGVSFSVEKGEIYGLLGPNGAGKTTTLKTMMGLISADGGSIQLLGKDASSHRSRENIGYLPEHAYFHEYLTPVELLDFYGKLYGMSQKSIRDKQSALLEKVGLTDAAKRPLKKFSKGMLQRVGLAQALLADPELLILDEPMSGLDPIGRKFVADLIVELNRSGKTILFSSHILSDVERLCSRVAILRKGEKVAEGRLEDLLKHDDGTEETLESLFVRKAMEETPAN
ncbi:MAG: ABC transporter ATP-binding protein [Deltaproteobacteria bacterium]|nr:ABC transporter ATP-binding protein [Deltaproteobacteria bacterium]MBN2673053.1 ABC transporter ATP-binding protein [Deltaproteobacteria bacterium]